MSGMICGQKMMLFQLEICYSELYIVRTYGGLKMTFFFKWSWRREYAVSSGAVCRPSVDGYDLIRSDIYDLI